MKTFTFNVTITCEGAALTEEDGRVNFPAVAALVERTASRVRDRQTSGQIKDANGNTVGTFWFDEDEEE